MKRRQGYWAQSGELELGFEGVGSEADRLQHDGGGAWTRRLGELRRRGGKFRIRNWFLNEVVGDGALVRSREIGTGWRLVSRN